MAESTPQVPVTQRVEWVDTARGIAMLAIVLGHIGVHPINVVVYTFHVPVFFLITGWFLSRRMDFATFTKKRARVLLVPYVATCLVICVGKVVEAAVTGGADAAAEAAVWWPVAALYAAGTGDVPKPESVSLIGAIWFLWACFWGCVWLRALLELKHERVRALIVVAVFVASIFSAKVFFLPLDLQPGGVALGYMYLGWAARQYVLPKVRTWPRNLNIALLAATALVWLTYIPWHDRVAFVEALPGAHWLSTFGILSGCVTVFVISWLLTKALPGVTRPLRFLGKYSLIMMCVHMVEMWFIDYTELANSLIASGMPYLLGGGLALALKFAIIITGTVILAKWGPSRRLFGFPPSEAKK